MKNEKNVDVNIELEANSTETVKVKQRRIKMKSENGVIVNIGLDLGNSETNIERDNGDKYKFKSLISDNYDILSEEDKIKVDYNNKKYSIGIGTSNINMNKYYNDKYKIMFLTAITKVLKNDETNVKVNVTISVPVITYKNKDLIEKIRNQIKDYQTQNIIVDDKEYTITINNVGVYVESGLIIQNKEEFKKRKIIVVDIGGLTIDSIEFEYGVIINSFTEQKGILIFKNKLYNSFKNDIMIELDINGRDDLFESVFNKTSFVFGDKEIDLTRYYSMVSNYVSDIIDTLVLNFSLSDKDIRFIGGGSMELKDILESYIDSYNIKVMKNADFLNAKSNLRYTLNNFID